MSFDIEKVRADFPILSRQVNGKPLVYLDSGASAQKPQVVIDVATLEVTSDGRLRQPSFQRVRTDLTATDLLETGDG